MSQLYHNEHPTLCLVYFDIILPTVTIILLIMMLPAFYKYVKSKKIQHRCLYWSGFILFIVIFVSMLSIIFSSIYFCKDIEIYTIATNTFIQAVNIQGLLLLGILFARLYVVFDKSMFALSPITIRLYSIFYSMMIIVSFVAAVAYPNFKGSVIELVIVAFACLLFILLVTALISLFLYKVAQVYRYVNTKNKSPDEDTDLIAIITKTSGLGITSIFLTLLHAIFGIIAPSAKSVHLEMLYKLFAEFDVTTNFWCIILSYKGYNEWYLKICGYCDLKCAVCWHRITRTDSRDLAENTKVDETNVVTVSTEAI